MHEDAGARATDAGLHRRILALALPALGALIAEPLFLATDTALVGHLGAAPLAALGIAATVLQTVVGLLVFLAYATTPIVGRRFGAGDLPGAWRAGVDGIWLALGLGAVVTAGLWFGARPLANAFGAAPGLAEDVAEYVRVGAFGVPAMLIVLAATGLFRGLQDTRTPLIVSVAGFAANAALNAALIHGAGLGLLGSAIGTDLAQWAMAAVMLWIVVRRCRAAGVGLLPGRDGVLGSARLGGWLFLRTLWMRVLLVGLTLAAVPHGELAIAAMAVTNAVLSIMAFALDALAIAGQSLIGSELGRGRPDEARRVFRVLMRFSLVAGVVLGAALAAWSHPVAMLFSSDPALIAVAQPGILVLAVSLPLAGVVYALDGVLIGAGDVRFLAAAGLVNLVATAPVLFAVAMTPMPALQAVLLLQLAWSLWSMLARLVPLALRARGDRWLAQPV